MQNSPDSMYQREESEISEYLTLSQKPCDVLQYNLPHQIKIPEQFQMQTHSNKAPRGRKDWHPVFGEETLLSSRLLFLKTEMIFQDRTVASLRR